jgi:hypothetical protein
MSIHKRWSKYTKKNVASAPDTYGIIEIGDIDTGAILYIGEGKIKTVLMAHNPDGGDKKHVSVFGSAAVGEFGYRFQAIASKDKAKHRKNELLSEFKKAYGSLPRLNQKEETEFKVIY